MGNIKFILRITSNTKEKKENKDRDKGEKEKSIKKVSIIMLHYWHDGVKFVYSTGQKIDNDLWNYNEQRAFKRKGRADLSALNLLLDKSVSRLRTVESELKTEGLPVSNENLKKRMDKLSGKLIEKPKYKTFVKYGYATVERYKKMGMYPKAINSTTKLLERFRPYATFEDIDVHFHDDLVAYMIDKELNEVKEYTKNYIGKVISTIKLLMNQALEEGHTKQTKYQSARFKRVKEPIYNIYLSLEELEKMHDHDFSKRPQLDNSCDLFLLGAFTGLRFSDFTDLKLVNFVEGEFVIQETMKVTSKLVIPQHRVVKEILAKRDGELPTTISNVKLNLNLKKIGELAGITQEVIKTRTVGGKKVRATHLKYQLITTHTARRSLATNMYLAGIPIKTIMTITGHSSVAQLMDYIKITEVEVADSLKDHSFFK